MLEQRCFNGALSGFRCVKSAFIPLGICFELSVTPNRAHTRENRDPQSAIGTRIPNLPVVHMRNQRPPSRDLKPEQTLILVPKMNHLWCSDRRIASQQDRMPWRALTMSITRLECDLARMGSRGGHSYSSNALRVGREQSSATRWVSDADTYHIVGLDGGYGGESHADKRTDGYCGKYGCLSVGQRIQKIGHCTQRIGEHYDSSLPQAIINELQHKSLDKYSKNTDHEKHRRNVPVVKIEAFFDIVHQERLTAHRIRNVSMSLLFSGLHIMEREMRTLTRRTIPFHCKRPSTKASETIDSD
jgi:hypothetical protein